MTPHPDADSTGPCPAVASGCPIVGGTAVAVVEDLLDLTDAELDARLRDLELHRRRLDAEFALAVGAAQQRLLYAVDGHQSMKGYLKATCNWSNADIAAHRRHAAGVAAIPGLGDAWHTGRVSRSQVDAITRLWRNGRVRDRVVEHAPMLIELAARMDSASLDTVLDTFTLLADPDGAADALVEDFEHRDVRITHTGGLLHLSARGGDPVLNEQLAQIFHTYCEREYRLDAASAADGGALPRTGQQRRYDAFVALMHEAHAALTSAGADPDADPMVGAAEGAPSLADRRTVGRAPQVVTNLVISNELMAAALAAAGLTPTNDDGQPVDPFTGAPVIALRDLLRTFDNDPDRFAALRSGTQGGTVIHPSRILEAALAGHLRRVVVDTHGVTLDMGRKARVFTGAAREAALLLHQRCDHPGCDLPAAWCQVDHTTEWNESGTTDQNNGRPRCGRHNRDKHRMRWRVMFDTHGKSHTIRPDGTIMAPVGADPPALLDGPPGAAHQPNRTTTTTGTAA